ncbi:hypothetical protein FN846DRAFT_895657 [Sphaerosporella brunnea]|uniref:Uncharacterized protein n=1 Tax=Sphaerosporella brunnea TaxID=1250544 RepID=A0A5J5EEH8_9PEZI|nr:hypothetical protein FN846DRAFT_895657 [Sphaerosporella brunnea]
MSGCLTGASGCRLCRGRNPGIAGLLSVLQNTIYGCLCAVLFPSSTRRYSCGGGVISAREMLHNWVKALDSGVAGLRGWHLSRMGVEFNVIPAVSTEAEGIFCGQWSIINYLAASFAPGSSERFGLSNGEGLTYVERTGTLSSGDEITSGMIAGGGGLNLTSAGFFPSTAFLSEPPPPLAPTPSTIHRSTAPAMHPSAPQTTSAAGTFNAQPTYLHLEAGRVDSTDDDDRPSGDTYVRDMNVLSGLNAHADTRTDVERMRSLIAGFINGMSLPTSETNYLRAQQYGASLLVHQDPNPKCLAAVETACCQSCDALSSTIFDVLSPVDGKRLRVKSHFNLCFFKNGYDHITKAAEYAVGPKNVFNPTFVVQVGWSEMYRKLQADARLLLHGTTGNVEEGEARLVALIKLQLARASEALGDPDDPNPQSPGDIIDELDANLQGQIMSGATLIPRFSQLRGFIKLWGRGTDKLAGIAPPGRIVTLTPY